MKRVNVDWVSSEIFASDGANVRVYEHPEGQCDVNGQAAGLRFHAYFYRRDANCTARLKVFESSLPGRPSKKGSTIADVDLFYQNPNPKIVQVNGPFCGRVEAILEIGSGDGNPAGVHMEIGVTLLLDS
jgi:hypothetical protein